MTIKRPPESQPQAAPHHQAAKRSLRKRRFPWAQVWVWAGTVVAIGFAIALVLKVLA